MINYHSCLLNLCDDFLKISVDYNIRFETQDETYFVEPPLELTEIISEKFDSGNFDFYKVYFKSLETEKVTRITDYKGVWGLLSLPVGVLKGSCVSSTHKIYFGIDTADSAMEAVKCGFAVCCPKSDRMTPQTVFSLIKELPAESFISPDILAKGICQKKSGLYIVYWNIKDMIELSAYGDINKIFSGESLSALKNMVTEQL